MFQWRLTSWIEWQKGRIVRIISEDPSCWADKKHAHDEGGWFARTFSINKRVFSHWPLKSPINLEESILDQPRLECDNNRWIWFLKICSTWCRSELVTRYSWWRRPVALVGQTPPVWNRRKNLPIWVWPSYYWFWYFIHQCSISWLRDDIRLNYKAKQQ